jgi:hypothetical protein
MLCERQACTVVPVRPRACQSGRTLSFSALPKLLKPQDTGRVGVLAKIGRVLLQSARHSSRKFADSSTNQILRPI